MKKILLLFMIAFFTNQTFAQVTMDKLPDNPEPGKCYVKCVTPDQYKNVEKRILVQPAYKTLKLVPAVYKTVTETVLVKEAAKKFVYVPAVYETVTVDYVSKEGRNDLKVIPASLSSSSEDIEVHPAVSRWEYSTLPDCESANPNDCQILCWKEYPAQIQTVLTQVLDSDAKTEKVPVDAIKKTYTKQVVKSPARYDVIDIPAESKEITRQELVSPERYEETLVEAKYKTVVVEELVKKGGVTVWEEIDCQLTEATLLPIFYDLNSAALTSESRRIIDEKLLSLMRSKPNIVIELSSHTDSRGNDAFNMDLSERRARSVVDYLISKGINSSRLVAKGYGETRLVNRCKNGVDCTEKEHRANRRTEFRVISSN
jgi:outer membrane protein OmpA-like peptidoglycan-associated protein